MATSASKTKEKVLIEERPVHKHKSRMDIGKLTEDGREILDPTPIAPPLGFIKQPSLHELMRAMVLEHHAAIARGQDPESFEEADDFDVDDDDEPHRHSDYEHNFDPIGEADRAALQGRLTPEARQEIDETIGSLQQPRQDRASSSRTAPVEGAAGGSPTTPSDAPAGRFSRVKEHFRRTGPREAQGEPTDDK